MILHIVQKDLRRLWPFVAGFILLNAAFAVMQLVLGFFPGDYGQLQGIVALIGGDNLPGRMLPALSLVRILGFFILVMAVQLDPLPGEGQDWLVRPIRRRDLLLAKLTFALLAIQAPLLAADLFQGTALGFSLRQMLSGALAHNANMFVAISLPALALGAVTRSVGQVLGLLFALAGGMLGIVVLLSYGPGWGAVQASDHTLAGWVLRTLVLVAGAALLLRLQYFRRRTAQARMVMAAFFVLGLLSQIMPQRLAFALEGAEASRPGLSLAFAPDAGRKPVSTPAGENPMLESIPRALSGADGGAGALLVFLPLRTGGLADSDMLWTHQVFATVTAANGESTMVGGGQNLPVNRPGEAGSAWYQPLVLRRDDFFRRHAGEKFRLELEYVLSVLHPTGSYEMPASGGALDIPGGPHCVTRPNTYLRLTGADWRAGSEVLLRCQQSGMDGVGLLSTLVTADGRKTDGLRHLVPGDIFLGAATFLNAAGVAPYGSSAQMIQLHDLSLRPLAEAQQLGNAKVAVTVTEKVAHLYRRVVIPQIRLEDWAVKAP